MSDDPASSHSSGDSNTSQNNSPPGPISGTPDTLPTPPKPQHPELNVKTSSKPRTPPPYPKTPLPQIDQPIPDPPPTPSSQDQEESTKNAQTLSIFKKDPNLPDTTSIPTATTPPPLNMPQPTPPGITPQPPPPPNNLTPPPPMPTSDPNPPSKFSNYHSASPQHNRAGDVSFDDDKSSPAIKSGPTLKPGPILALLFTILVVSGLLYYWYNYLQPSLLLKQAFANFTDLNSYQINLEVNPIDNIIDARLELKIHEDSNLLSYVNLTSNYKDESGLSKTITLAAYASDNDLYAKAKHTDIADIDQEISSSPIYIPTSPTEVYELNIADLKAYGLVKKVLLEDYWLHLAADDVSPVSEDLSQEAEKALELAEINESELNNLFAKSIKINKFDRKHEIRNREFKYISFGFNRDKLLDFFRRYSELNEDFREYLGDLEHFLNNVDNLDSGLVEILILPETNQLSQIKINKPKFNEDYYRSRIEQLEENNSQFFNFAPEYIKKSLENTFNTRYDKPDLLFTIDISEHDKMGRLNPPSLVVEFDEIMSAFEEEKEVYLMLAQMFTVSMFYPDEMLQQLESVNPSALPNEL